MKKRETPIKEVILHCNIEDDVVNEFVRKLNDLPIVEKKLFYLERERPSFIEYQDIENLIYRTRERHKTVLREFSDRVTVTQLNGTLKFNKQFYYKWKIDTSYTYYKDIKKTKFSAGCFQIIGRNNHMIDKVFEYMGRDWFTKTKLSLHRYLNKTTFDKILAGKITNPRDLVKEYFKVSYKINDFPYGLYLKFLNAEFGKVCRKDNIPGIYECSTNLESMLNRIVKYGERRKELSIKFNEIWVNNELFDMAIGPTHPISISDELDMISSFVPESEIEEYKELEEFNNIFMDTLHDAEITGIKINSRWGIKRLKAEHVKMSDIITTFKVSKDDYKIPYQGKLETPENSVLLDTKKEIHREGLDMHHCIYSNYYASIKKKNYFAMRCYLPERCTVGISLTTYGYPHFHVDQIYLKYDENVKSSTKSIFTDWLRNKAVQNFFFFNASFDTKIASLEKIRKINLDELLEMDVPDVVGDKMTMDKLNQRQTIIEDMNALNMTPDELKEFNKELIPLLEGCIEREKKDQDAEEEEYKGIDYPPSDRTRAHETLPTGIVGPFGRDIVNSESYFEVEEDIPLEGYNLCAVG